MASSRNQMRWYGKLWPAGDLDEWGYRSLETPRFLAGPETVREGIAQARGRLDRAGSGMDDLRKEIARLEEALGSKAT